MALECFLNALGELLPGGKVEYLCHAAGSKPAFFTGNLGYLTKFCELAKELFTLAMTVADTNKGQVHQRTLPVL